MWNYPFSLCFFFVLFLFWYNIWNKLLHCLKQFPLKCKSNTEFSGEKRDFIFIQIFQALSFVQCFSSSSNDTPLPWIQALLKEAHEVEVKKQKEEVKIEKQLAVNKEDTATEVLMLVPVKSSERCSYKCVCHFRCLVCLAGDNIKRAGWRPGRRRRWGRRVRC